MSESESITTAQFEALQKQISDIANTMDLRFSEWSGDRKDITDLLVRVKTIEAKIDGARDDIEDSSKKMLTKVEEHLSPMSDVVANAVKDEFANVKKKTWFQKLFLK
jgi:hypothetical protein